MKSVMQHSFARVPQAEIQRSSFDRTHGYKTTFDSGFLIPFYVDEVLPGDTFNLRASIFARMSTPIFPVMDNLYMDTFFFFVPNRLLWDNWQAFNGERRDPDDSVDFLVPQLPAPSGGWSTASLSDYFGLPTGVNNLSVSALFHRAYNLVYNEWFRDQNLQDSVPTNTGDGPDNNADYVLLRRGKRHDYFTSALPWPQKGPGVELPIGGQAAVTLSGYANVVSSGGSVPPYFRNRTSGQEGPLVNRLLGAGPNYTVAHISGVSDDNIAGELLWSTNAGVGLRTDLNGAHGIADLSTATAATINSLRQAFQVQKMLERDARGGTRYTEILRAHFGVISPDARLQRPEYLGGSSSRIVINPVQQTSSTDSTSPQGNLAAFGVVADDFHGFTQSFVEHGVIIGLVNVRADLTYQQGIPRMFSRETRYDFYWPALAHLGEQAILNKEIYAQGTAADDDVFGYQERFAEYRYFPSQITGKFRSTDPQSLDAWHLSQEFASLPVLNGEFIVDNPPVARVVAVQSEPQFIFDSFIQLRCARPMPMFGVPGLIDHF